MITKQDILDRATEWQMRPDVVEKDYVLGWVLAGLSATPLRSRWIFKGGTSIKKCYFETYRFSEDLDFSLLPDAPYSEEAVRAGLVSIIRSAGELSGIRFPEDRVEVRPRRNQQGQLTFEGRISYSGPLEYPGQPRVLFDITQHELVIATPSERPIFHPYPDAIPSTGVRCYSFNELLAEKTRALYERSRPRDLYDVVFLLENQPDAIDLGAVRGLFIRKCQGKRLPVPSAQRMLEIVEGTDELRSEWVNMLGHQLPALPNLDDLLRRLPGLLEWIDEARAALPHAALSSVPVSAELGRVAPAGIQYWGGGLRLESVRFAGANRLLIEFDYDGKRRVAEPYSLRRAGTGNVLLYAWEQGASHIKAFNTAKLQAVRVAGESYTPRYRVEFTAAGGLEIPSLDATAARTAGSGPTPRRRRGRRRTSDRQAYVIECTTCGKRFVRASNDRVLRKHKAKGGSWSCTGRRGYLVRTR